MRDRRPATQHEEEQFANDWGIYANEHLRDAARQQRHIAKAGLDEVRWGDTKTSTFTFVGAGALIQVFDHMIQAQRPARTWSVHVALTMLATSLPSIPAGDDITAFFEITAGLGASKIVVARSLNITGPSNVRILDSIVADLPASDVIVGCTVVYNSAGAKSVSYRVDAAVAPTTRPG